MCSKHPDVVLDDADCLHCHDGYVDPEDDLDFGSTTCHWCKGRGFIPAVLCYVCEDEFADEEAREGG